MDLRGAVEFVRNRRKELTLFNVDPRDSVDEELATYFATQNVEIATAQTASGAPEDIAVLSGDDVRAVVDVSTLRDLLDSVPPGTDGIGFGDAEYEEILAPLKETTFTSCDRQQLFYASREIEDRARRVGQGTIHAGFQQVSTMADQQPIYAGLASQGVDVHTYGIPDADLPDLGPGQVHAVETDEIATTWFVVFDGGGDDSQKTALVAKQEADGSFCGVWTYDPGIVDSVLTYLNRVYATGADDPLGAKQ